ncbi:MAG: ATP-binding protein [Acidobacteria bacterium]|nr:MAG: ATP-binding protein [Acidobacteriota bacterium]
MSEALPTKTAADGTTTALPQSALPGWSRELSEIYLSSGSSVFILHGNIHDLVPLPGASGRIESFLSLEDFLSHQLFGRRDSVIRYDRGSGISFQSDDPNRIRAMRQDFDRSLQAIDLVHGTDFAKTRPKDPRQVLELLDRYILHKLLETNEAKDARRKSVAIVIRYAEVIAPGVDAAWLSGEIGSNLIKLLNWANDPAIRQADITICLLCENLSELNRRLVENPFVSKIEIPLPNQQARTDFIEHLFAEDPSAGAAGPEEAKRLAAVSNGLTLVGVGQMIRRSLRVGKGFDSAYLKKAKKELIEKECYGLLEFIDPKFDLRMVIAQEAVRERLQEDAILIREGALDAVPMGYLLCGMLGTGKTFTATCFAGSIGIPAVVFKDIREKWVGSSERNMQKVLSVIRALGPVMVVVDEADAALGKRSSDGDSGTSGRLFAMVSSQMSNTEYRGRIIWVLLTARPDLLTVDLKRQGRCEVHIPLFPPQTDDERREMFLAMARKNKLDLAPESVPPLTGYLSGADIESLVIQATRLAAVRGLATPTPEIISEAVARFVSPNYSLQKELQELVAIRECTDLRFLPERFRPYLTDPEKSAELEHRIQELTLLVD